jgi:predicted nucleic acid-binding protein
VIVVSDSSPLITLARAGQLDLLRQLFGRVHIAEDVRREVVVLGVGRPTAEAVRKAEWIESHPMRSAVEMLRLRSHHSLGAGELATVLLASLLRADLAIIDERAARRLAQASGLAVMGCVGILEMGFRRGRVVDLRASYQELLVQGIRIDRQILNRSLAACGLPSL